MIRRSACIPLACLLLNACAGGSGGDDEGDAATMARVQAEVFDVGCNVATCHSATAKSGMLILESGMSHDQLVDVTPDNPKAAGEGLVRVKPGDPDQSFLLQKCRAGLDPSYGTVMPQGNPDGLSAEKLALLEEWIAAGAPSQ